MLCSNLSKKTLKAIGGPDIIADEAYYIAINSEVSPFYKMKIYCSVAKIFRFKLTSLLTIGK